MDRSVCLAESIFSIKTFIYLPFKCLGSGESQQDLDSLLLGEFVEMIGIGIVNVILNSYKVENDVSDGVY